MKKSKELWASISPARRIVIGTLALCILIAIAGAIFTRRSVLADASCNPLWTFNDGSRLWLCPPDIHPIDIAFKGATPTTAPLKSTPVTAVKVTATFTPVVTATFTPTITLTPTVSPTPGAPTVTPPAVTPLPTPTQPAGNIAPYPAAPLCLDVGEFHDNTRFHTLWNAAAGCHYDHEHGTLPFTSQVDAAFPGFNLYQLIGNVGVGHTNLSSPLENTLKHGGFKWNVQLAHPEGCTGFESAPTGVNGSVIEYHSFGDQAIEFEARVHTTAFLVRQCKAANPNDFGYVFGIQFQDYGQRIIPYQGTIVAYPNQPVPAYDSPSGPYLSADCVGPVIQCRSSLQFVRDRHLVAASNWASKPTGQGGNVVHGSKLFTILFRIFDDYRMFDWSDQVHPFTWLWVCSLDGGIDYEPLGCRYNNSTSQVHEIQGDVPPAWDNLAGFDTNPTVGRVTADGFVTAFGDLVSPGTCMQPNVDCFPVKLVNAFTGRWGSVLVFTDGKGTNIVPGNPSRNIYFCGQTVCAADAPGAVPSGWLGTSN